MQAPFQSSGPQHIKYDKSYPEHVPYSDKELHRIVEVGAPATPSIEKRRIFGLNRTVFIALVVAAILTVAAAIGGGVGGALSSKKKASSSELR